MVTIFDIPNHPLLYIVENMIKRKVYFVGKTSKNEVTDIEMLRVIERYIKQKNQTVYLFYR